MAFLTCDGSYYSKTTYAQLYSIIGDVYTVNLDGDTPGSPYPCPAGNFLVPDYRTRTSTAIDGSSTYPYCWAIDTNTGYLYWTNNPEYQQPVNNVGNFENNSAMTGIAVTGSAMTGNA